MASNRTPNSSGFGRHLRSLRKARDLTQEELSERCELSTDTIRRLERGDMSPSLDTSRKLGGGLGLRLSVLFESYELGKRDTEREVAELLAGREPREIEFIFKLVRTTLDGLDALKETAPSTDPEQ
jgi:transcriptional regulator with XRE-family HTH domain